MLITMRPTGGHSPVYADRQDWTIFHEGQPVRRIYEDVSAGTSDDLRWFWSITVYVWPDAGVVTSGKAATSQFTQLRSLKETAACQSPRSDVDFAKINGPSAP